MSRASRRSTDRLGQYSFKSNSSRVCDDGKLEINWEGTATGFGVVISTMTVMVGDGKSGHYDQYGVSYRDDGTVTTSSNESGEYKSIGTHKWATTGVLKIKADGRELIVIEEGTMELATKTWNGNVYEASYLSSTTTTAPRRPTR
jgi:hypothetical protein